MKVNSDYIVNPVQASHVFESFLQSPNRNNNTIKDIPSKSEPEQKGRLDFLNNLWKKLITSPQKYYQTPNSTISSILEENTGKLASKAIRSVLANKLELSLDSIKLSKAIEDSFEIYHEDYPFDFILEYKGERLGIFLLDKCLNSNGEAKLVYRFSPDIKSFRGLY